MSFLAPLFLIGGMAVAAPVLFHLIRRTTREQTPFSSMMFLTPSPPRITKRSRLEHLFLLFLRCLVLLLLAAGFARPFLTDTDDSDRERGAGRRTLVLVDASASMQRTGVWEQTAKLFDETLKAARPGDALALYCFDHALRPLVSFARLHELPEATREQVLRDEFAKLKPGWGSTQTGSALARAAGLLEELEDEDQQRVPSRVVLISDLQEGSELAELQAFEWPEKYELKLRRVTAKNVANAGIQYLPPASGDAQAKDGDQVKVRVFNSVEAPADQFRVHWSDEQGRKIGDATEVYVPAGQSRVVALERPATNAATRIVLLGDREPFDNAAWIIPPEARSVEVVYAGRESADDVKAPFFFLQGALPDTRDFRFNVRRREQDGLLRPAGLTVVTAELSEVDLKRLREFVQAGGVALFAPRGVAGMISAFQLFNAAPIGIEEVEPSRYALLGEIDFRHPLFAPFSDPRFSDFSKIHFWKYRRFPADSISNARVLAHFDNDDPAIVQAPLGKGFVMILASCWHPADCQLALSTKFVPLVHSLLDLGGLLARTASQHLVGAEVALPFVPDTLIAPGEGGKSFVADSFAGAKQPGVYRVKGGTNELRFAVNLDPRESRTDALAPEELERYGVMLQETEVFAGDAAKEARLKNSELEQRQKLWRWLIAAALVILSIEALMAGRIAKRPVAEAAA